MTETGIRLPERLKPGDRVGIAAPSSPFSGEDFDRGVSVLEARGYPVVIPDEIFQRNGYLAGSDRTRADVLNRHFADPSIRAIFCARGGFGAMRILPFLDLERIRRHPKIFVGFSDITVLLHVLENHCGMAVFHGPLLVTLNEDRSDDAEDLFRAVSSPEPVTSVCRYPEVIRPVRASGTLTGGNLTLLCHLMGTPYAPRFEGKILFIEDQREAAYRIDRMLTQMRLGGAFDGMAGLAVGDFSEGAGREEIVRIIGEIFRDFDIPILAGFDAGHGMRNETLPFGIPVTLDTEFAGLACRTSATTERSVGI